VKKLRAIPISINWHSGLPIFASEPFLRAAGDEYGWIGGIDDSDQPRCILPYTIIRKLGFRIIRFRVETVLLDDDLDIAEEKSFLNSAIECLRSRGADMIIPAPNTALFRVYPEGALAAPYGTLVKDLGQPEELLWNEVHADFRQNIRKAARKGVEIKSGMEYLDVCYRLIADTLKRSNMKFRDYGEFLRMILSLGPNVRIFIAECAGEVQACMVAPFSEHSAYDWYSGTSPKPMRGAMHLLVWEAIRQFHDMGVKRLNFTGVRISPHEGSKQEGILNFKLRFGGKLVQGYAWKYSLHPLKFAAYSVGIRLLKGGDIVDLERHKLTAELAAHDA